MKNFEFFHKTIFVILSSILILILFYGDSRHDYSFYTLTWESFANNENKVVHNGYGPIHLLLSYLFKIHYLVPKILFGFSFIFLSYLVFKNIVKKKEKILLIYFYITLQCNFLIISGVFFYGLNDALVTFFFYFFNFILFKSKIYFFRHIYFNCLFD